MILFAILAVSCASAASKAGPKRGAPAPSKAAAERCGLQLKSLEDFVANGKAGREKTTRFSEEEINSYLALNASSKYHPSLKSLTIFLLEGEKLEGVSVVDFDRLGSGSSGILPGILSILFSGKHTLAVKGKLISRDRKGRFELEEAQFDGRELSRFLVEQIITAVGRRQKPPFDPLQPSELPYKIQKVEVHEDYLLVHQ
jgi:hypothetical protein